MGEILVDTKGVSRLLSARRGLMMVVTLVIVGLSSPAMERPIELLWLKLEVLFQGT